MSVQGELWHDADGNSITLAEISQKISSYVNEGGKIYIGTDSMLSSTKCVFATAICIHDNAKKIALYYVKRRNSNDRCYSELQDKIFEEVNMSILTSRSLIKYFPESRDQIEVHADVGRTAKSATRTFVDLIRGWVQGLGFACKVKPESWASSSVADWHTK